MQLGSVPAITSGGVQFAASGADGNGVASTIDLSGLTTFSPDRQSSLSVSGGGVILGNAGLTSLAQVNLTLSGSGSLPTGNLTSYNHGSVNVSGQALDLGKVQTSTGSSFVVGAGVTQSLPQLTSYAAGGTMGSTVYLQANGAGSVLDLSAVQTFSGKTTWYELHVQASSGGRVQLGSVPAITSGGVQFAASGADGNGVASTIDLSGLTTFAPDRQSSLSVSGGGVILGNAGLTSLAQVNLTLSGSGSLPTGNLTSYNHGSVNVSGQALDLGKVQTSTGSSFVVGAGVTQSLPQLTSYAAGGTMGSTVYLQANGAGSVLDLSAVQTFSGKTTWYELHVQASSGGRVQLGGVAAITSGGVQFAASGTDGDGVASTIDLSGLTTFAPDRQSSMSVSGGGVILGNAGLTSLAQVNLTLSGSGSLPTGNLTSYNHGSVNVSGQALDLGKVQTSTGSSFVVGAGVTQSLPQLTSYAAGGTMGSTVYLQANGAGSVLDLSAVQTCPALLVPARMWWTTTRTAPRTFWWEQQTESSGCTSARRRRTLRPPKTSTMARQAASILTCLAWISPPRRPISARQPAKPIRRIQRRSTSPWRLANR